MQNAPILKPSGLLPLEDGDNSKGEEIVHVFGKNLEDRVVAPPPVDEPAESSTVIEKNTNEDISSIRQRKFDAITGEEDEETAFQSDYKLFLWSSELAHWTEKGRGLLKLNDPVDDKEGSYSRIIMRISGTLRILLNVSLNPTYFKILSASDKIIRFTDSQTVWAARGNNASKLKELAESRLDASKKLTEKKNRELETLSKPSEEESAKELNSSAQLEKNDEDSHTTDKFKNSNESKQHGENSILEADNDNNKKVEQETSTESKKRPAEDDVEQEVGHDSKRKADQVSEEQDEVNTCNARVLVEKLEEVEEENLTGDQQLTPSHKSATVTSSEQPTDTSSNESSNPNRRDRKEEEEREDKSS